MEDLKNDQIPEEESEEKKEDEIPKFRGLYRYVKITVRQLDMIIIACILVIVLVVAIDLMDPGITVSFNSLGGTDVAPQEYEYGELLEEPVPPTREGYVFTGWYKDSACFEPWNPETDIIEMDTTLYAGWEKKE